MSYEACLLVIRGSNGGFLVVLFDSVICLFPLPIH